MKKIFIIAFIMLLFLVQNFNVNSFPIDKETNNASIKNSNSTRIQQIDSTAQSSNSKIDTLSGYQVSYPLSNYTWGGPNSDYAFKMANGENHTLFFVGQTSTSNYDLLLIAWNTTSNIPLWNRTWGGSGTDVGYGVAVGNGVIYTVGYTTSFGNGSKDLVLLAWNYAGNLLWYRTYGDAYDQEGLGIALSPSNDSVYTVGFTNTYKNVIGAEDVLLISWDISGNINWYKTVHESNTGKANAIAVDSNGYIYTAGFQQYNTGVQYTSFLLQKWTNTGAIIKENTFNYSYNDNLQDIVINKQYIYTVGEYSDGTSNGMLIAWDLNCSIIWYRILSNVIGYGITFDNSNNVIYITGETDADAQLNVDFWVSTYSSEGNFLTSFTFNESNDDDGRGITIFNDTVYCIGFFNSINGDRDIILIKDDLYSIASNPLNLNAIFTNKTIELSWEYPHSTGGLTLQQYNIYRSTSVNGSYSYLTATTNLYYNDDGNEGGVTYYYKISVANPIGNSTFSNVAYTTYYTIPSNPYNLQVVNQNQSITLTWSSPVSNGGVTISNYNIYRSINDSYNYELLYSTDNLSFIDANVSLRTSYYYEVSANNSIGVSQYSNQVTAKVYVLPDDPSNITVGLNNSNDYIKLHWNSPIFSGDYSNLTYYIYRSDINNTLSVSQVDNLISYYHFIASVNGNDYLDYNVSPTLSYNYYIRAHNSMGLSNRSNIVSITAFFTPSRPLNVQISHDQSGRVYLTWNAPRSNGGKSIIRYNIYKGINNSTNLLLLNTTTNLNYTDYTTNIYDHNYYIISAVNAMGESRFSDLVDSTNSPVITTIILVNSSINEVTGNQSLNSARNNSTIDNSLKSSVISAISTANPPLLFIIMSIPMLAIYKKRRN